MTRLEQLRSRLSEVREEMRAIAETDADELTEEQDTRFAELETELEHTDDESGETRGLLADIAREERRAQLLERAQSTDATVERGSDTGPNVNTRTDDPFDPESLRVSPFASAGEVAEQVRGQARTAIERTQAPDEHRERMTDLLERHDGSGALARRIIQCGSPTYERAFSNYVAGRPLNDVESRALSSGTDASGGFAIPVFLDPSIMLTSDGQLNPVRQVARVETITTNEWQGVTSSGVTASYAAEAAEATDDAPTLARGGPITPERAHVFIPFSYEAAQDWPQLRAEMARLIMDAKDELEATKFISGAGSASNEPQGVVSGLTATQTVSTGTAATFAAEDVYSLDNALPQRFRARATVLGNKTVYNDVRQFASSDGHDLWERIGAGRPAQLLGYPALESTAMDSDSTTTSNNILLVGDFQAGYLIIDRVGMSVEVVPHVFGTNQRPTGQRGLYAFWRNSADVVVPNAFRRLQVA